MPLQPDKKVVPAPRMSAAQAQSASKQEKKVAAQPEDKDYLHCPICPNVSRFRNDKSHSSNKHPF